MRESGCGIVCDDTVGALAAAMQRIADDHTDPKTWDVHHWQELNPVVLEGLVQLTLGGPQPLYHGGLLHCRVRYFDPQRRRPGLPPDVALALSLIKRIREFLVGVPGLLVWQTSELRRHFQRAVGCPFY